MIKNDVSTVSIIDENILLINVRNDHEFTILDYKALKLASIRLAKEKEIFNIISIGDKTIPDKAAREACTFETGSGWIRGEAIIVHSLGQRIVARHIIKRKRKQFPVKLFTSFEKAKGWIDRLKLEGIRSIEGA